MFLKYAGYLSIDFFATEVSSCIISIQDVDEVENTKFVLAFTVVFGVLWVAFLSSFFVISGLSSEAKVEELAH